MEGYMASRVLKLRITGKAGTYEVAADIAAKQDSTKPAAGRAPDPWRTPDAWL
jgi:hypothetical protein